ncbi:hypothetical protein A2U01_0065398, partial [Trifolium medium]|nr:hypothetical protein [Trifolium medium]
MLQLRIQVGGLRLRVKFTAIFLTKIVFICHFNSQINCWELHRIIMGFSVDLLYRMKK